jgi:hypothetical protein
MFKPGPLYARRKQIVEKLQKIPLQTGDIVYSASDVAGPLGIPFGKLIQTFTKSPYSHATLILVENGEYYAIDVSDWGTRKLRVVDWFDNWHMTDFCVARLIKDDKETIGCMEKGIRSFLELDPSYDFNFNDPANYYCTEAVTTIFSNCGIDLGGAYLVKDIVPYWFYTLILIGNVLTKIFTNSSLPTTIPISIVGNSKKGMLASDLTQVIFEYEQQSDTAISFI